MDSPIAERSPWSLYRTTDNDISTLIDGLVDVIGVSRLVLLRQYTHALCLRGWENVFACGRLVQEVEVDSGISSRATCKLASTSFTPTIMGHY